MIEHDLEMIHKTDDRLLSQQHILLHIFSQLNDVGTNENVITVLKEKSKQNKQSSRC